MLDNKTLNEKYLHKKFFSFLRMKGVCIKGPLKRSDSDGTVSLLQTPAMKRKQPAFSLVELLMALLVASLLMAALAPVMTKRVSDPDIKVISEAANYDKDSVITIFTDASEQKEFNIPSDASRINITMVGGGGAGGNALYGNKEFTTTQNFTVPKNVKKLRVFMIGGGGGGASGGVGAGTAYGNLGGSTGRQEYAGSSAANTGVKTWTIPSSAKNVPEVDYRCTITGNTKWTLVSDTTKTIEQGGSIVNVKACGGGGGGGCINGGCHIAGGGGGSGGYINKAVPIPSNFSSVQVTIGGGGGGGGGDDRMGSNGVGWGGGGGGSENCSANYASGTSPGGNGAYLCGNCPVTQNFTDAQNGIGTIGGGLGYERVLIYNGLDYCQTTKSGAGSLDGGGGGGGAGSAGNGGGGGGATFFGRYAYSTTADKDFFLVAPGGGGGGGYLGAGGGGGGNGGGKGGDPSLASKTNNGGGSGLNGNKGASVSNASVGGKGGASPIGNNNYCSGGDGSNDPTIAGISGKNGYMEISWGPTTNNPLKCDYSITANGGGGGAAGQITINEINVTPGETLTFEIGAGGLAQAVQGENGNNGKATYIKRGTNILASAAGGYGGKFSSSETTPSQGGSFRNPNIGKNWTEVDYKEKNSYSAGSNGILASTTANTGYGGAGGYSQDIKGSLIAGGIGGNTSKDGLSPLTNNYGAGGGGGSGSQTIGDGTFGKGGAGAAGYIYIEWGGSNGGGGTNGEIVQRVLTNFDMADRKMLINIGKGGSNSSGDANGGTTTLFVKSGGKNVTVSARGGIKGDDGHIDVKDHGNETEFPTDYSALYKDFVQENMNIIMGQKGTDDYGGVGGYLACIYYAKDNEGNKTCAQSVKANDGIEITAGPVRPGCGGSAIPSPLYDAICNAKSTAASPDGGDGKFGGGGGGGAVLNGISGLGGNGGDGFIILEYKSVQ